MSEDRTRKVDAKPSPAGRDATPDDIAADRDMEAAMSRALAPVVAGAVNGEGAAEPKLAPVPSLAIDQPAKGSGGEKAEREAPAGPKPAAPAAPAAGRGYSSESPSMPSMPAPSPMAPATPRPAASAGPARPQQSAAPAAPPAAEPDRGQSRGASMADMQPVQAGTRGAHIPAPNRVFDHLVEGDDDVIGLICYSLYKRDKRDWILAWRRQHDAEPTADQVEAFVAGQMTHAQRDRYRSAARQVLDAYASVAVEMEKPLIVREGIAGRVDEAVKRVESSGRWWKQFPAALLGGMLATAILVGVIAILVAFDIDIAGYLGFE